MSSTRHWNVKRHISRTHDGMGEPSSSFMRMEPDVDPNSIAQGFNHCTPAFHRRGSGGISYSQHRTTAEDQGSKTLVQSIDEFMQPIKKLVEFKNLLDQLLVSGQQQQAWKQFFSPTIIPSAEFGGYEQQPTSAHPIKPSSVPDFYEHIKLTADKFALD